MKHSLVCIISASSKVISYTSFNNRRIRSSRSGLKLFTLKNSNELKRLTHTGVLKKSKRNSPPLPFLFQFTLTSDHSANKLNERQKQILFPPSLKQLLCSQGLQGKAIYVTSPVNTAVEAQTGFWTFELFVLCENWKGCVNSLLPSAFARWYEFPVLIPHNYHDTFSTYIHSDCPAAKCGIWVGNLGGILKCKKSICRRGRRQESALRAKIFDYKSVHYQKIWVILF